MLSNGKFNTGKSIDQPDALMLKIARYSSNSKNDNIGKDHQKLMQGIRCNSRTFSPLDMLSILPLNMLVRITTSCNPLQEQKLRLQAEKGKRRVKFNTKEKL